MIVLTAEQILFVHHRLIEETGGAHGVRDVGLLASAFAAPHQTSGGRALYTNLLTQAATLLRGLVHDHPFLDGNKRTAISAAGLFLELNGRRLNASPPDLVVFALHVAEHKPELREISDWLKRHSTPF